MIVRLILGDQLNKKHSWYTDQNNEVLYFMAEMRQETDYVVHHIQKVVGFFMSMRNHAKWLREQGHKVLYYTLNHPDNQQQLAENITQIITQYDAKEFQYQLPDEYRLDKQLQELCSSLQITTTAYDTEHFLTSRTELQQFFEGKKQYVMEYFYRYMRKRYDIMMIAENQPEGNQWNFDQSNRKKWKGEPEIYEDKKTHTDVTELLQLLKEHKVKTIGNIDGTQFYWPTSRNEFLDVLQHFCEYLLVHFGDYQDAMHTDEKYLFHSKLSFALNTKQIDPLEVIETAIQYWRAHKEEIEISQIEGFVRQILGWREYMRGIYWAKMPKYKTENYLNNTNRLPEFYWTGDTKMNCMHHAIKQSLDDSYAHHIQRLMVTGNYALLTQTDPDAVDQWYLGIYIDAIEWVEITNTRGMSQYADGGVVATKPYVSSGSYINKMSNYCKGCHYKVSKKIEKDACPFNSLYWNFLDEKRAYLENNQRMSMMMSMLNKMDNEKLVAIKNRANAIISSPDEY